MKRVLLFFVLSTTILTLQGQQWGVQGYDLYRAVPDGRVDSVWKGINIIEGFSGKDVIIGVTDWGFDYSHPVFYDTTMTQYRVLRAWDQYRKGGPAPEGFDYGTELIGKDALLAVQCDTSNVYSYGYHGTHVASIAAGAGAGTNYRGVAYDADLLFVSIAISEQAIEDAFLWMYKVAQQEQKRLVINMSWGLYYMGNMDGTGKMANLVDSLSDLGVVFVTSAGNNGDENFHLGHTFSSDTLKSRIGFTNYNNEWGQSISMTNSENTSFSFAIQVSDGSSIIASSPYYNTADGDRYIDTFIYNEALTDSIIYNISIEQSNEYNNRPQVRLRVKKPTVGYLVGLVVTATQGEFHAWNVAELKNEVGNWGGAFSAGMTGWVAGDKNCGIGTPASFPSVITIAAHESAYKVGAHNVGGNICSFSSYGTTIDNRLKPEISAPGNNVIAAVSSFTDGFSGAYTQTVEFEGRTYPFAGASGTSMSSPFVAGVVALILQANPYLTSEQIKEILIQTAYQDEYTQQRGTVRFGYGKVDAYQAILKALETTGIADFKSESFQCTIFPNPTSDMVYISIQGDINPVLVDLYDFSGRLLKREYISSGVNTLNMSEFSSGCYMVKIQSGQNVNLKKLIKN